MEESCISLNAPRTQIPQRGVWVKGVNESLSTPACYRAALPGRRKEDRRDEEYPTYLIGTENGTFRKSDDRVSCAVRPERARLADQG
jgi:hypothetical protein